MPTLLGWGKSNQVIDVSNIKTAKAARDQGEDDPVCNKRAIRRTCKVIGLLSLGIAMVSALYCGAITLGMTDTYEVIRLANGCDTLEKCPLVWSDVEHGNKPVCMKEFCQKDCSLLSGNQRVGICDRICVLREDCTSNFVSYRAKVNSEMKTVQLISLVFLLVFAIICVIAFTTRILVRKIYRYMNDIGDDVPDSEDEEDNARSGFKYLKRMGGDHSS